MTTPDRQDIVERFRAYAGAPCELGWVPIFPKTLIEAADTITALRAENDALRRDAERYRRLCVRWDAATDEELELFNNALTSDDLDAAIDAALSVS